MILSNLQIKDLTRALQVSKYWYNVINEVVALKRVLFLAPDHSPRDHLNWKHDREGRILGYPGGYVPVIRRKPSTGSKVVVQTHPALRLSAEQRTCIYAVHSYPSLKTIPPCTLLSQPPLMAVSISFETLTTTVKRKEGVTIGDVLVGMQTVVARDLAYREKHGTPMPYSYPFDNAPESDDDEDLEADSDLGPNGGEDRAERRRRRAIFLAWVESFMPRKESDLWVMIEAKGVVAEDSKEVQKARKSADLLPSWV